MLTREQVEVMPAGQRLDVLVAELVMGWKFVERYGADADCLDPDSGATIPVPPDGDDWIERGHFFPSRDIGQAWSVVLRLSLRAWCCVKTPFQPGNEFMAEFDLHSHVSTTRMFRAFADTLPLAVCRAALLFVLRESLGGGE